MSLTEQTKRKMKNFWLEQAIEGANDVLNYGIKHNGSLLDAIEHKIKEILFITGGLSDVIGVLSQRDFDRVCAEIRLKNPEDPKKKFAVDVGGIKVFCHPAWKKIGYIKILVKSDGVFDIPNPIIGRTMNKREKHAVQFVLNWIQLGVEKNYDIEELLTKAKENYGLGNKN